MSYEYGDWVVYDPGYKQEVGRVTTCREGGAFVCYNLGCTAAFTPYKYLRPATPKEIAGAMPGIGFHRFDGTCPVREDDCCFGCKAVKR
jgi:hypothetical protein